MIVQPRIEISKEAWETVKNHCIKEERAIFKAYLGRIIEEKAKEIKDDHKRNDK